MKQKMHYRTYETTGMEVVFSLTQHLVYYTRNGACQDDFWGKMVTGIINDMKTFLLSLILIVVAGCTSHPGTPIPPEVIEAALRRGGSYIYYAPVASGGGIVSPTPTHPTGPQPCEIDPTLPGCMGTVPR